MHIAFVDESGDPGLRRIDPTSPYFALTAALYRKDEYLSKEIELLARLKHSFWSHEGVILRSYDIRKRQGPFSICKDSAVENRLRASLCDAVAASSAMLISAVINKPAHKQKYASPVDPYDISMSFVLERVYMQIRGPCTFVFESRGQKEDVTVQGWFEKIAGGENPMNKRFPFTLLFSKKADNVIGLQIADLVCRPILFYVERGENSRPDWLAVRSRLRQSPSGQIAKYGLKVFPLS